jgi:uridine kinase
MPGSPRLVIGVAGGTGSGKTTVARSIVQRVGRDRITEITQDSYYRDLAHLEPGERAIRNFDHPDAIEVELLAEHLGMLRAGESVDLPDYDFAEHVRRPDTQRVESRNVILVEGILILALPEVRRLLDIRIFVDTPGDIRFIRRLRRDVAERGRSMNGVIDQYLATVRPMHEDFVEPSKRFADVILPEGGRNTVALEILISRIEQDLRV